MPVEVAALKAGARGMAGDAAEIGRHAIIPSLEPVSVTAEACADHFHRAGFAQNKCVTPVPPAARWAGHYTRARPNFLPV